jgi:hypothetical protein
MFLWSLYDTLSIHEIMLPSMKTGMLNVNDELEGMWGEVIMVCYMVKSWQ